MPYEIVNYPAAVLMRPARRIGPKDEVDLPQLFTDMVETMNLNHGVGLAAPQIGLGIRFIVAHNVATQEDLGLANPQIVRFSRESDCRSEGCLSFPELFGDVERALSITVRYQDLEWNPQELEAEGHFARVLQHEIDHLNGVLLIDRAVDGLYKWEEEEEAEGEAESAADEDASGAAVEATTSATTLPEAPARP